jgi:hypothetical protein
MFPIVDIYRSAEVNKGGEALSDKVGFTGVSLDRLFGI